jgi:hypothetical protein
MVLANVPRRDEVQDTGALLLKPEAIQDSEGHDGPPDLRAAQSMRIIHEPDEHRVFLEI